MERSEAWSRWQALYVQLCRGMRVLLASLVVSSIAGAEPRVDSVVRLGYSSMSTDNNITGPDPSGSGPCGDGEVTWRYEHVSVGLFGAFYTLRANMDSDDQRARVWTAARYELFDASCNTPIGRMSSGTRSRSSSCTSAPRSVRSTSWRSSGMGTIPTTQITGS